MIPWLRELRRYTTRPLGDDRTPAKITRPEWRCYHSVRNHK